MRILHVTDTFLPRVGGIEHHVADLASRQRDRGHDVLVLTAERGAARMDLRPTDLPVATVNARSCAAGRGRPIRRILEEFTPDVVHVHLTIASPLGWAVMRRATSMPVITTMHSLLPAHPGLIRAGMRAIGLSRSAARATSTAVSEVAAARFRSILAAGCQVGVLHNGIDPALWVVPHRPSPRFSILVVGRLEARKRPLAVVRALDTLARCAPRLDWEATFVGDGSQRTHVDAMVRAAGLERHVHMAGSRDRDTIRELLGSADVFVAPAHLESFGIAALEARCAGVPVVGMASGGLSEFIDDQRNGLLARSDAELARCIHRLATDADLGAAMRLHNATTPVAMAWENVLDEHDHEYGVAIERAGRTIRRSLRAQTAMTSG